ncbi:hypothetical protein ANCDUO_23982 [Ancylostoma duodenale]|uniref:Uncharacterized protein n=1 Tax=Ancylostoma duodenale TaxID=51022 RepID=A0A0C2BQB0_9BILA|nr:hypothetical protein ANCDUO_23982 [Ancylostoma duodenale]
MAVGPPCRTRNCRESRSGSTVAHATGWKSNYCVASANSKQPRKMDNNVQIVEDSKRTKLLGCAGAGQIAAAASNRMDNNKVFMEEGTPEATAQYYQLYVGAAAAKYLYGVIRRRAPRVELPELRDSRSQRTATTCGEGVSGSEQITPAKRARPEVDQTRRRYFANNRL